MVIHGNLWKIRSKHNMIDEKELLDFLTDEKENFTQEDAMIQIITAGSGSSLIDVIKKKSEKKEQENQTR